VPRHLNVSEFRSHLLGLVEDLPEDGLVITKRGRPVARVLPIKKARVDNRPMFGALKNVLKISGDVLSTGDKWDAES
jgi:prevent-host-death family protein